MSEKFLDKVAKKVVPLLQEQFDRYQLSFKESTTLLRSFHQEYREEICKHRRVPHVYFILDKASNAVKIGIAVDPQDRQYKIQAGNPNPLELIFKYQASKEEEKALHKKFAKHRVRDNQQCEWFSFAPEIKKFIEKLRKERRNGL